MEYISSSVGRNGANYESDVIIVQSLLNHNRIPGVKDPLELTGKADIATIERIESFQKFIVFMAAPDGRVDPKGKTFIKMALARGNARAPKSFTLSKQAIDILKSIEELATMPYDDQTGSEIKNWGESATIGYGHLISKSDWPRYKDGISEKEAQELFQSDLTPFMDVVRNSATVNITQNEFDAMVIFAFNIGSNGFKDSSVIKIINNLKSNTPYKTIEDAWKAWNKSKGKINNGIINRRNTEWNIYTKGIYKKW